MAILDIWEIGDREGSDETSGRGPLKNYTLRYGVEVSPGSEDLSPLEFMADSRIPSRLTLYPFDPTCICRRRRWRQQDDPTNLFIVDCEFTNQPIDGEKPDEDDENPCNRPADISWDSEEVRQAAIRDLDNIPILNSAYQLYERAIEIIRRRRVITIVKNRALYNDSIAEAYEECTNSAPFLGKPTGTVYCKRIAAKRDFQSNMYYFPVTHIFVYDPLGWTERVVDAGTAELMDFGDGPVLVPIKGNDGTPIVSPVFLNGMGQRATGSPPTPYIFEYRVHNRANFNGLSL